ncbi:Flp pilus assembly protein CpaB [Zobellella maritima]|uniref:Flp pilus assembly protein CpaB n=1 Tax=Zobellella maritima TaxID=2059725 RepID=UPI000E303A8A|nr:Flp pilus assembly protein CpaB [Zobellella maritima]
MNSRLTLGLAGVMLAGAVVAGYQGLKFSNASRSSVADTLPAAPVTVAGQAQVEQVEARVDQEQRSPVVVLARELAPLVPISVDDLMVEQLRIAPPGSFSSPDELIGRQAWQRLPAGLVLKEASFEAGGPLARMIGPNERALAIAVDEVVAGGGFISPGDYVDVLLYLRESDRNRDQTAQVVVPGLRVLSYGKALGTTADGEPVVYASTAQEQEQGRRRVVPASTVVLAVPQTLLTRFMLATQVGTLRLAVRSADEQLLADYYAKGLSDSQLKETERQLFQFEKLALRQFRRPQQGLVSSRPAGIQIYRGPDVSRQTP